MSKLAELVLIPSAAEWALCEDLFDEFSPREKINFQLCGWGPIHSAIRATRLILECEPVRVWLVGIAGVLRLDRPLRNGPLRDDLLSGDSTTGELSREASGDSSDEGGQPSLPEAELAIGRAYEFHSVAMDGIGVGQFPNHVSFQELKWDTLFGGPPCPGAVIDLNTAVELPLQVLSVCSASANLEEARQRQHSFPNARAEDMESYSVASACQDLGASLRIIRGISNRAGDRNHANWRTREAMRSAVRLLRQRMSQQ